MTQGESIYFEDQLFRLVRHGTMMDTYFTLSYSPIRAEDCQVAGTLVVLRAGAQHCVIFTQRHSSTVAKLISAVLYSSDSRGMLNM